MYVSVFIYGHVRVLPNGAKDAHPLMVRHERHSLGIILLDGLYLSHHLRPTIQEVRHTPQQVKTMAHSQWRKDVHWHPGSSKLLNVLETVFFGHGKHQLRAQGENG